MRFRFPPASVTGTTTDNLFSLSMVSPGAWHHIAYSRPLTPAELDTLAHP